MARYLIGIDLGTTNSALAYLDLERPSRGAGRANLQAFAVPQIVAPGDLRERPLLPSFHYLPGETDLPPGAIRLPWDAARSFVVGEFARNHGGKIPGRLVASAKSWLCHSGVDRSAALLPWSAPAEVAKLSPVEVSTRYLRHFVETWNYRMAKGEEHRIEKLPVVLTVPASFDDVARTLTMEAAAKAGLENVILLEEPQAAFYCWLATHPPIELTKLKPGSRCLVVDVGGGTTDFSMIEAVEDKGEMSFVRQAVGDHLLLGGDNMDLALAKFVEAKLPQAGRLDAIQYALLTQAARAAKEVLLGENPPPQQTVTVLGRGSSVIGNTLKAALTGGDVQKVFFEGFFPPAGLNDPLQRGARAGLHEMGLPYVSDPAITRHLAAFLNQQKRSDGSTAPDAILFNGGVFTPQSLRDRLLDVMRGWYGPSWQPLVLTNPSLDLAVALGAAYYAWVRHTGGKRIGGGIPRSYYVAVGTEEEKEAKSHTVVCVVPQHLEEGQEVNLPAPVLELALGQPVAFPLFCSTVRGDDKPGQVLTVTEEQVLTLPPLTTVLRGGKRAGTKHVPVTLAARLSAIGTMELFCVAKEGSNRWKLEFNIRGLIKENAPKDDPALLQATGGEVWQEHQVDAASKAIRECFNPNPTISPAELPKALETALEATRSEWPTGLCRRLWDSLAEVAELRRSSPQHLTRWFNLVGHCLRPGFGDPMDRFRVEALWKLVAAPQRGPGVVTTRLIEGGADFWVLFRRVAGGLNGALQQSLLDRARGALLPGKKTNAPKPNTNELTEMWRAVASLERIDVRIKEQLGNRLVEMLQRSPIPPFAFWALTRIGARSLLYGPLNAVVQGPVAERWIDAIEGFKPSDDAERAAFGFCLAQLARRTGQRALDIDEAHQEKVLTLLRGMNAQEGWITMVLQISETQREEQGRLLGEALPIGLRLMAPKEE